MPPMAEIGKTYKGRVVNITKFGAFVNILPGRDGLVHISKLGGGKRINAVEDVLELGQEFARHRGVTLSREGRWLELTVTEQIGGILPPKTYPAGNGGSRS